MGNFIVREATVTVNPSESGVLDADNDACVVDVKDLERISIFVNQLVDNGNATLTLTKSIDGVNYAPLGSAYDQDDFAAGVNKSFEVSLSDSNGMPLNCAYIKMVLTGSTGTGTYSMTACGTQREGYR